MPADRIYNVLFLCTGNSARSVMGEVLLNKLGAGHFHAFSAGSQPKGAINPMTIEALSAAGLSTEGLRSKSWDEFAVPEAPKMDFVFTVCDDAANETCPIWPGQPISAHWGIEDPAAAVGTEFQRRAAFEAALGFMRNRITAFVNLPLKSIDHMTLRAKLQGIGAMHGASVRAPQVA